MLEAVKLMRNEVKDILPNLAPKIRTAFVERLEALEISLQSTDSYSAFRLQPDWMKREFEKLVALLSLPPGTTDVYQHGLKGDPAIAAEIDRKQKELADSYDEPVRSQLNDFMNQARYFYSHPDGAQVPALFLQGPPGTGKTFAAKTMTESVLKGQLITIPMHKLAEYLDWSDGFQIHRPDDNKPLLESVGMAWQKLISEAEGNVVWFIDEVDFESNPKHQALIEAIKMWLNQENTDFPKLQQLGISPNIRGPVIFASNYKLDEVKYRAFVDRLTHVVQFPHWSAGKLKDRAESYLQRKLVKMTNHHREDAIAATKAKAEELLPSVLELAGRFSPEDITLRDIYRTIDDIVYKLAIAADTGNSVDNHTLMNSIEKSYNSKAGSKNMPSVTSAPARRIPRVTAANLGQFLGNASLVEPLDRSTTAEPDPNGTR